MLEFHNKLASSGHIWYLVFRHTNLTATRCITPAHFCQKADHVVVENKIDIYASNMYSLQFLLMVTLVLSYASNLTQKFDKNREIGMLANAATSPKTEMIL